MAEHLRERILESVKNTLTGLHETGMHVDRRRAWPHESVPSIDVVQSTDSPLFEEYPYVHRDLEVILAIRQRARRDLDTWLNRICTEITQALQSDITQGIAGCYDTIEGDTGEVEVSDEGDQPVVMLPFIWSFRYRTTRADPTTDTI